MNNKTPLVAAFDLYIDLLKDKAEVVKCWREGNKVHVVIAERLEPRNNYLTMTEYFLTPSGVTWRPLGTTPLDDMQ
jgi:hypothetical protein